jgi:predicted nucleic acid-binding Zn ribbon protein
MAVLALPLREQDGAKMPKYFRYQCAGLSYIFQYTNEEIEEKGEPYCQTCGAKLHRID